MKLVYFNGRGLAENSRLLLALANQEYEDYRYPLEVIDWATHNLKKDEFEEDQRNGKLERSLNKVPYLEIDGTIIHQSKAIERYLARSLNMMGENELDSARIDAICETIRDFKTDYQNIRKLPADQKDDGMKKWFSEDLPARLQKLEVILDGNGHSVSNKLSLADVTIFSFINQFFDAKEEAYSATENTPKIRGVVDHLSDNSSIQAWISKRPETSF